MTTENLSFIARCDTPKRLDSPGYADGCFETFFKAKLTDIANRLWRMSDGKQGERLNDAGLRHWVLTLSVQLEQLDSVKDSLTEKISTNTKIAVEDIFTGFEEILSCVEKLDKARSSSLTVKSPSDSEKALLDEIEESCLNIATDVQELMKQLEGRPSYWGSAALILGGAALWLMGHTILAPVVAVTGLGWAAYQFCCNSKLRLIKATIQLLTRVRDFVQNSVLVPIYEYAKDKVLTPICNRWRPETRLDARLTALKSKLQMISDEEDGGIQDKNLHHQLGLLSNQLEVLNLTKNLLPDNDDFRNTEKIAKEIIGIFNGRLGKLGWLSLVKEIDEVLVLSPTDPDYLVRIAPVKERVKEYFQNIRPQLDKLKKRCDKSQERKEELDNWKTVGLTSGSAVLFAGGHSALGLSLPVGSLWLAYEVHHRYRGKILDQAVALLNLLDTQEEKINSQLRDGELAYTKVELQKAKEREVETREKLAETQANVQSVQEQIESNTQQLRFLRDNFAVFAAFVAIQNGNASVAE